MLMLTSFFFYQKVWVKPGSWQGGGSSGKDRSGPSAVCVLHLLLHFLCFSSLLYALDLTVLGRLVTLNCIHITYHLAQP